MTERTIKYTPPGEIDGEPYIVAKAATMELDRVLLEVSELIEGTVKQVENAGRQLALDEAPAGSLEGTPSALDEYWRENRPQQAARAELLRQFGERLPQVARALSYAVSRGE